MLIQNYFPLKNFSVLKCIRVANVNSISKCFQSTQSSEKQSVTSDETDWFNIESNPDIESRVVPKPVSYLPDHLGQNRKRIRQKPWWKFRYFIDLHTLPLEKEEYTKEPEYPPIFDSSSEGIKQQIRLDWYAAIRNLPSAQEKIYEITKHYSHLSYFLEPTMKTYNALPIQKYITRTELLDKLPVNYLENDNIDESLKKQIISMIESRLYLTKSCFSFGFEKTSLSQFGFSDSKDVIQETKENDIIADIIQLITNFNKSSFDFHIDYNPFVGTSWWVGDFPIPFKKKKWFTNDRHNQCFVYKGNHNLHVRTESPLPKIVPMDDELCKKMDNYPQFDHNLLHLHVPLKRHYMLSLPGFWPGISSGFDFPYLLTLSRDSFRKAKNSRLTQYDDENQDLLDGMAITSAFSWLTSIANNLGFTIYDPLTYPIVTHIIITDGQNWSFYVYQLNNHCFHEDIFDKNKPCNLCWSSGNMKLFDINEEGKLINIDDNTLNYLIKFFSVLPETEVNYELRPYLSEDLRTLKDQQELNYSLRRKFSNYSDSFIAARKKTNLWEKIYKNHKDASLDFKRLRPKIEMKYPPFFK